LALSGTIDEVGDSAIISSLAALEVRLFQDCRFGLLQIGKRENMFRRALSHRDFDMATASLADAYQNESNSALTPSIAGEGNRAHQPFAACQHSNFKIIAPCATAYCA